MATYYVDGAVGSDANLGTSQGVGNAWATISHAVSTMAAGDTTYVKASATYNETPTLSISGGFGTPLTMIGYTTTPGDGGQVTIDAQNTRANCLLNSATIDHWLFFNFIFQGPTACHLSSSASGLSWGSGNNGDTIQFHNCKFIKGSATPAHMAAPNSFGNLQACFFDCEIGGFTGQICTYTNLSPGVLYGCYVHDATAGFNVGNFEGNVSYLVDCLFANIPGPIFNGGSHNGNSISRYSGNIFYNCGPLNVSGTSNSFFLVVENNIFANGTGYGVIGYGTTSDSVIVRNNAYYSMTSGLAQPNTYFDGGGNISLSVSPFTNAAAGDFTLNSTAGGGLACQGIALPSSLAGKSTNRDLGAYQHTATGGGGGASKIIGSSIISPGALVAA